MEVGDDLEPIALDEIGWWNGCLDNDVLSNNAFIQMYDKLHLTNSSLTDVIAKTVTPISVHLYSVKTHKTPQKLVMTFSDDP